ncbi:MAG: GAF domain-containing protein [Anaerolineae bacterium]|nr:GAF domain-containing protein [Anaerolineae bacterium]
MDSETAAAGKDTCRNPNVALLCQRLPSAIKWAWSLLAVMTLGLFAYAIIVNFAYLPRATSMVNRAVLELMGLSPEHFALFRIIIDIGTALVFFIVAGGIFWRITDDWVARLMSVALLTVGVAISPSLDPLLRARPAFSIPIVLIRGLAIGSTLAVFYIFPDGKFFPRWTRPLTFIWAGWALAWLLFPTAFELDLESLPLTVRFLMQMMSFDVAAIDRVYGYLRVSSLTIVLLGWFGSGVFAQVSRYTHHSSDVQRQQTKWVVLGLTAAVIGYFGFQLLRLAIPPFRQPGLTSMLFEAIGRPISAALILMGPLAIAISVFKFRLWAIDPLIQRGLVYGTLTTALGVFYFGSVIVFQQLFRTITGYDSTLAIAVSTLIIFALGQPLRRRLQDFIDRRFYRERIDFRRAFTNFSREVRTIIDLPELLRVLVDRTTHLVHAIYGAVFLRQPDGTFALAQAHDVPEGSDRLTLSLQVVDRLQEGHAIPFSNKETFPLIVPLLAPQTGSGNSRLVGVLALGPRLSGQGYSREDQTLLTSLADQAGTAIYVAQVVREMQDEATRREEAERHLAAYRNSPAGRAEALAQRLIGDPEDAMVEMYLLAQQAGRDPEAMSLMDNLPSAFDSLAAGDLARLAEGFNYILAGRIEPGALPVGIRMIVAQLEALPEAASEMVGDTLGLYRLGYAALQADSISQIIQLDFRLPHVAAHAQEHSDDELFHSLEMLHQVAEALRAYERVDTTRDQLAYLASAVERLQRVDHMARTELGGVDQVIVQRVVESWLGIVTGAMGELQTRAQIVCRLLTRHTWQEDVVSLALSLTNEGRGAALNLRVALAPAAEYTLMDEVAHVERLAPGEEVRVELRVRPHIREGVGQFRARFLIVYTDPRGPDQVENFADVVHLLAAEEAFQFIPNPYVVGTPLSAGSPLFYGREGQVAAIQESLSARHRNNLVLIGQRRTGKTSLLKQLPVRLGDEYLPVYLDGQTLGLDPGLPNFFLTLATEIAFAAEDCGFDVGLPEMSDFAESPVASFEHRFLAGVREAIGERHLLIMFDEFEELESAVQRGALDASVFGFLRHLIQHSEKLSVIFCGTHRLEELASDYWNVLFNISLYQNIRFLEKEDALRLIQEPVKQYGMRYDDLTLDKMWRITAGHPYFLQLLCHSLVNRHNRTERSYVTVADLNAALDEILASGEAHFVYLWTESTPHERLVLTALSRMIPLTGHVGRVQVVDYFAERGVTIERREVSDALHRLALRDVLASGGEQDVALGEVYRWRLGLLGLWVEKYKSLSRVIDEVRG